MYLCHDLQLAVALFTVLLEAATALNRDTYIERRQQALQLQRSMRLGATQTLTEKEELVNRKLMQWKQREINQSLWEGTPFPPELHFFHARPLIERSPVFQFIRQLPKGGNLHNHFGATVSLDWFVRNVTYRPYCYVCRGKDGLPLFHFFGVPPDNPDCPWRLVAEERKEYSTEAEYDTDLARNLSVVAEDPDTAYPSIRAIWLRFEPYFIGVLGAVNYLPVFSDYLWRNLEEFLKDRVQYLEIRFTIELYDLDGSYSDEYMVETILDVVQRFKKQHPDFIDAKIIIASIK